MHYYSERFIIPSDAKAVDIDTALMNQVMSAVMTAIDAATVGKTAAKERAFDKAFSVMVSSLLDAGISKPIAVQTARRIDRSAKFALADYGLAVSARQQRLIQQRNRTTRRSGFNVFIGG
jgi:hypothetical protein